MSEKQEELEAPMSLDEAITAKIESMTASEKDVQLRTTFLLCQSERFTAFIDENFDIHQAVNHETKTIDLAVIEKPEIKEVSYTSGEIGLDVAKSLKAQMLLKNHGVTKTAEVLKEVYKILGGHDEQAIITSATDADIRSELDAQRAAAKIII